ncbi:hypothetical protein LZ554_008731 [Drepanopeziza brunnea f. sp. 'monogermtubi']|nr:hypothetical protein LZ554_008731 [Drepanopeziza brunnea f. sp. 'monogermtubi']
MQIGFEPSGLPMYTDSANIVDGALEEPGQTIDDKEESDELAKIDDDVRFSHPSYFPNICRKTMTLQTDGSEDLDTPARSIPGSGAAPDDYLSLPMASPARSGASSPAVGDYCSGLLAVEPPSPTNHGTKAPPSSIERLGSKGKRNKNYIRFQGSHPFVPGKIRHKHPGGLHHKKYTQYVYSHTSSEYRTTHQYLCETSDLEKPVYYYHDVGGYTRLDPDHRFTLHLGNHSGAPILGAMWHSSGGMHFAVGSPFMDIKNMYDDSVSTIQRQHCDYLKPISSAPTRWHMDFSFGGGEGEGPQKTYRWQVVHVAETIPQLRREKLELREKHGHADDEEGKKKEKCKLLATCRNVDELSTNLWVREVSDELGDELARMRWKSWVLLTWGAMRDRMRGPHNTGSPYHDVGYTQTTKTVQSPGGLIPYSGFTLGGCILPVTREDVRERSLNGEEY